MIKTLYDIPFSSGLLLSSPLLNTLPGRQYSLDCDYENEENGDTIRIKFLFTDVVAFKCTYKQAVDIFLIKNAYEKLVELEQSQWKSEVLGRLSKEQEEYKHFAICFDDGPSYEFICKSYGLA